MCLFPIRFFPNRIVVVVVIVDYLNNGTVPVQISILIKSEKKEIKYLRAWGSHRPNKFCPKISSAHVSVWVRARARDLFPWDCYCCWCFRFFLNCASRANWFQNKNWNCEFWCKQNDRHFKKFSVKNCFFLQLTEKKAKCVFEYSPAKRKRIQLNFKLIKWMHKQNIIWFCFDYFDCCCVY